MKSRVKKKTDINRTGNKKIFLQAWENVILALMDGDSNPVINRIEGATSVGVLPNDADVSKRKEIDVDVAVAGYSQEVQFDVPKKIKIFHKSETLNALSNYETDLTRKLSTQQLQ
ncbi:unnamed protein product [Psylliodes chrysocephalus]|uniref:Uncharacterized protein n=1 Tax=Psylliodes chrysocephalus TaxID=3402493 RepID=A0A9P0GGT3_9CUCU|nr:unnamed protein product [Psylliodes chrysocephala]